MIRTAYRSSQRHFVGRWTRGAAICSLHLLRQNGGGLSLQYERPTICTLVALQGSATSYHFVFTREQSLGAHKVKASGPGVAIGMETVPNRGDGVTMGVRGVLRE